MATAVIARLTEAVGSNPSASILANLQGTLSAAEISILVNNYPRIASLQDQARTHVLEGLLLATACPSLSGPTKSRIDEATGNIAGINKVFEELGYLVQNAQLSGTVDMSYVLQEIHLVTLKSAHVAQIIMGFFDDFPAELRTIRNTEYPRERTRLIETQKYRIDGTRSMLDEAVSAFSTLNQKFNDFVTYFKRDVEGREKELENRFAQYEAMKKQEEMMRANPFYQPRHLPEIDPSLRYQYEGLHALAQKYKPLMDKIQREGIPAIGFWIGILSTMFQTCENDVQALKTWAGDTDQNRFPLTRVADEDKLAESYRNWSDHLKTYVGAMNEHRWF